MKKWIITGLVVCVLGVSGFALATSGALGGPGGCFIGGGHGFHGGPHGERFFAHIVDALDLTEEQQAQAEALKEKHKAEVPALRRALAEAVIEAVKVANSDTDQATLDAAYARVSEAGKAVYTSFAAHMDEFRAILMPEQMEKLEEIQDRLEDMARSGLALMDTFHS